MIASLFKQSPLDKVFKKLVAENKSRILLAWNGGLGGIPLQLYALCHRIQEFIPHASITVLTRSDLIEAFSFLPQVKTITASKWKKGEPISVGKALNSHHLAPNMFDMVMTSIDAHRWLKWQWGCLVPKLYWNPKWDELASSFNLGPKSDYVAVCVEEKQGEKLPLSLAAWRDLLWTLTTKKKKKVLLFGKRSDPTFLLDQVIDLRNKTSILEMVAIIKNHCASFVAPDSAVAAIIYFLHNNFPLRMVSLLGNRRFGLIRQGVLSPNHQMEHTAIKRKDKEVRGFSIDAVCEVLWR